MISTRDICMIAAGAVLGGGVVAAAGYFGVIRQYIPLRDLERELDDVRRQYMEYKHKLEDLHREPEPTEDVEPSEHISHGRPESENVPVDDAPVDEPSDVDISDDEEDEEDEEDEGWDPFMSGHYDPLTFKDGRYYLDDDNPRWDGPLNDEEMELYRSVLGDEPELVMSVLTDIRENRYIASMDEDEPMFQITADEHFSKPEFFETRELDYYEDDDILALGREVIPQIERYINPICLNHFGEHSGSGDPNVVWCRNDKHEIDYEITRHADSYQHAILGIKPGPNTRPPRRFRPDQVVDAEEADAKRSKRASH